MLRIDTLHSQVRRRRHGSKFQGSWGLDCSGAVTQHDWHKNTRIFNRFTNLETIKFQVPIFVSSRGASLDAGMHVSFLPGDNATVLPSKELLGLQGTTSVAEDTLVDDGFAELSNLGVVVLLRPLLWIVSH